MDATETVGHRTSAGTPVLGNPARRRRAACCFLRMVLPWTLVAQLLGTLLVGRSWPDGFTGKVIGAVAFIIVGTRVVPAQAHRL